MGKVQQDKLFLQFHASSIDLMEASIAKAKFPLTSEKEGRKMRWLVGYFWPQNLLLFCPIADYLAGIKCPTKLHAYTPLQPPIFTKTISEDSV